ncbi:uncharacterized protein LOC125928353 isoform X2 [Panthera uncia]|uniref:uncharacterized protein LOC125928353 isoform X2 n=1 Tax=Panthera uncia TaxID=29064 RepID=UPI0020FF9E37|nr:uncharacterized protein LOC125928353 isoform X2 [Panthera uncia]
MGGGHARAGPAWRDGPVPSVERSPVNNGRGTFEAKTGPCSVGAGPGRRGRGLPPVAVRRSTCSALSRGALGARPAALRTARVLLRGSGAAIMSTAMNFGSKSFQPRPPDKGSFPLDHFGS